MTVSGSHLVLPVANHPFRYLDATAMAQAFGDATCGGLIGPTLSRMPTTESVMNVLPIIKRSIVIMYDRGRSESSVNGERLVLFTQQVKEIENIPPT